MVRVSFTGVSLVICSMLLCENCANGAMTIEQLKAAVRPVRNSCIEKTGVDIELLQGMANGEFPDTEELQCYTRCVMTALRSFKNGKPALEAMLKQMKMAIPKEYQERAAEIATYCVENTDYDDNPCIAAMQFVKCTYDQNPKSFFFP